MGSEASQQASGCSRWGGVGERDELRIAFYSSEQNEWSDATVVPGVEETALYTVNNPVYVAGQLLWPDALSDTASTMIPGPRHRERDLAGGGGRWPAGWARLS